MRKTVIACLKLIIFIIFFLRCVTVVNAQSMTISPNEFGENATEFSGELQGLNPNIQYEFRIICKGKDYVWKFIPNKLSSSYWIGGDPTRIKFVVYKKDAACGFRLDDPLIEQLFQTTLSWLGGGKTEAQYKLKPSYNCQIAINPATFDLTTKPENVLINISGLPPRSGAYGIWLVKKDLETGEIIRNYSTLAGKFVDNNGNYNLKYSDFRDDLGSSQRPIDPDIYTIHLQYADKGMICQAHFRLETYIPPNTTPSPPPVVPTSGPIDQIPDLSVVRICDSVKENDAKDTCEECVINGKIWTALGCIKTDISGFVGSFFQIGLGVAGGIAFLFLIYGGVLVMTSAGNPETVQQGKDIITSAITGLLLIIFSVLLLQLISVDILKIPGFSKQPAVTSTSICPSSKPIVCNADPSNPICCASTEKCVTIPTEHCEPK